MGGRHCWECISDCRESIRIKSTSQEPLQRLDDAKVEGDHRAQNEL